MPTHIGGARLRSGVGCVHRPVSAWVPSPQAMADDLEGIRADLADL